MKESMSVIETPAVTRIPAEGDNMSHSSRNGLLCALVVAAIVLVVNPAANMPFMDSFSYDKTALDFARTGHFIYNGWATAMLGWLIPWGALFIKLFGFSFTVMRLSMLPIAMATVYLFHEILRRFEINSANAILGTLTLALSPLFLPLATTYMTDVPGLFVILVCIYMCQRAVTARTDRAALVWLSFAMLVNVAGGTVRQIAWLGALVMVPSTAWLLRDRRGMKFAGVLLWGISLVGVWACLHWFNAQPYSVPEHVFQGLVHTGLLRHLMAQLLKTFLCLLLVIFPVSVVWLTVVYRLSDKAKLQLGIRMAILISMAIALYIKGRLNYWMEPWLIPVLEAQSFCVKLWMRLGISLVIISPAFVFANQILGGKRNGLDSFRMQSRSWKESAWILGPFSLSYVLLLVPRGTFALIQDRYVLVLFPIAIIVLLRLFQERVNARLSTISLATLIVFAAYSIAGTHDFFARCRALVHTIQILQSSGVPRSSIQAGMESDGWVQIEGGGHINDSRIQVPAGAYKPYHSELKIPTECTFGFASLTPAITPKYFLTFPPMPCFSGTRYPPITYRTWLPPFHRTFYVQQLRSSQN